ncbi:DNA primase [Blattabacterium cuenoti]|uniref:DNA primase n=1 Tax=Blattabacterium cuenoti TaxID=1653831 RepID=UPI00163BC2B5|nr:DNA primase [Blattabacterium cuenoti]
MISKETIKKIFSVSCIEEVIGDFIVLKKSGINYRGLSPFSNEKTPSLIVSPTKKIWKDFSSGKGGNMITFLMEHEHFTYVESLHYLAKKYDINIYEFKNSNNGYYYNTKNNNLYLIQKYAKCYFSYQLHYTQEGKENGLNYLMKKRKLNIKTIHEFELGYAPASCNLFTETALKKGFSITDLKKSGLTRFKQSNSFDCFRKRVIFPIQDIYGKVIGFGGRTIHNYSRYTTKYLNSSENDIFQKSKILYGLFQAKKKIFQEGICYLVEGYTDVLSLHQSGIKNVVSSSGTSLNIDQIRLIKKLTKTIVLFYDGDFSGIQASLRVINMCLEQEMNIRILFLSNGEDPDSISKKYSSSQLRDFIVKNSYNFVSFKKKIYEKFHKDDPVKKYYLIFNILNSISKIYNPIQRELYIQETSKIFKICQKVLISELERICKKKRDKSPLYKKNYPVFSKKNKNIICIIEEKLIHLILNYGDQIVKKYGNHTNTTILEEIRHTLQYYNLRFSLNDHQRIFDQICLHKDKKVKLENFQFLQKKQKSYSLSNQWKIKGIEVPSKEENLSQYLIDIICIYKAQYILKLIQKEISNFNKLGNNKDIIKKIMHLTKLKNKINKKLHRLV